MHADLPPRVVWFQEFDVDRLVQAPSKIVSDIREVAKRTCATFPVARRSCVRPASKAHKGRPRGSAR